MDEISLCQHCWCMTKTIKGKCGKCKNCKECANNKVLHTCPYQSDVNNDDEFMCSCCDNCTDDCAMEI